METSCNGLRIYSCVIFPILSYSIGSTGEVVALKFSRQEVKLLHRPRQSAGPCTVTVSATAVILSRKTPLETSEIQPRSLMQESRTKIM